MRVSLLLLILNGTSLVGVGGGREGFEIEAGGACLSLTVIARAPFSLDQLSVLSVWFIIVPECRPLVEVPL